VRAFEQHVYRYGDRHRVKSGLTGWAQVNGLRGETSLDDRIEWDNYYARDQADPDAGRALDVVRAACDVGPPMPAPAL
jgi:hypothetical protein